MINIIVILLIGIISIGNKKSWTWKKKKWCVDMSPIEVFYGRKDMNDLFS
jgi:hypothetical protein